VAVSELELRLREVLETIFMARPRFKEILIGYPAILSLVYLYRRYPFKELVLILGLGAMMGTISIVNSFSHVFTAITISASRTLAGLWVGIVIGLGVLLGIWILEKIWEKWIQPEL
jgi:H+/Cl- antiporter ClcA